MSGGPIVDTSNIDPVIAVLNLLLIGFFALIGGLLVKMLGGYKCPNIGCLKGFEIKPILTTITIPLLVGMIIFGCIARNIMPQNLSENYNDIWAGYLRMVCLSVILLRGGLELEFEGKGITVVLLTLLPQIIEASSVALAAYIFLDLPFLLCYALGFILGAVSPAVLVPSCMLLQSAGYGVEKGIPTTLIAASSFDDIIAISVFGVFNTLAFKQLGIGNESPMQAVLVNIYQIFTGLAVGVLIGLCMYFTRGFSKNVKAFICLFFAFLFVIVSELTGFHESKYMCVIVFGYLCYRQWGHNKPEDELAYVWNYFMPFLFGTVGAAIKFSSIKGSDIFSGIIVILCGVSMRWVGAFLATWKKMFTLKERMFMGFAWIPKATVQAAIGGIVLETALQHRPLADAYIPYGQAILTTAVISVVITAPAGAILTNTLGPLWLEKAKKDPVTDVELGQELDQYASKHTKPIDPDVIPPEQDSNQETLFVISTTPIKTKSFKQEKIQEDSPDKKQK